MTKLSTDPNTYPNTDHKSKADEIKWLKGRLEFYKKEILEQAERHNFDACRAHSEQCKIYQNRLNRLT